LEPKGKLVTGLSARSARSGEQWVSDALLHMSIVSAHTDIQLSALSGGVSSDIYRVDLPAGVTVCVKRALAKLRVAADWRAPVSRNHWEAEWMRVAGAIAPSAVPRVLGEDRDAGCFAMEYFPAERFSTWKTLLASGTIDATDATLVAQISVAPAELASCLQNCGAEYRAHAGSGVAQIFVSSLSNADDLRGTLARWREIAHGGRGNLRVLRVNDELREGIGIFDTPPKAAFGLMHRLKNTFDPHGIFNPGCFVGGL